MTHRTDEIALLSAPVTIRREPRKSGLTLLHLDPPTAPVVLSPAQLVRVAQIARLIESTRFPVAYYCEDEIIGLRSIARELRVMVGWPAEDPLMPVKEFP